MATFTRQESLQVNVGDYGQHFKLPENVEEEAKILHVAFYRRSFLKIFFYYMLSVLSLGIIALLAKWKIGFRIIFKYYKATPQNAEFLVVIGSDNTREHVPIQMKKLHIDSEPKQYRTFIYRLYTYYYDAQDCLYKPIQFLIKDKTYEQMHQEFGKGITSINMYEERVMTFGDNSTDIPMKTNLKIIMDEILSPFYVFQLFSLVLWFTENYIIYACVIFIISASSIAMSFNTIKKNYLKLREKAHFETTVQVFRSDSRDVPGELKPMTISSIFLIPGDLIEVPDNQVMPCDILLLKGTCVMNESMLTGESVPVIKHQLPVSQKMFDMEADGASILFSGTKCLETKKSGRHGSAAVGVVLRSGFSTMKGRLIRSLLYGKPENFRFYRDSAKYIAAMACMAVICFLFSLQAFIQEGASTFDIFKKSLDVLTIAVPPALATCLSIGCEIASGRLEQKGVITKSQTKINVAGRVDVMCFDKTGTLTEDSLDLYGVKPTGESSEIHAKFLKTVKRNIHNGLNKTFGESNPEEKSLSHMMLELMATCHSLTPVRGVISGDPLDLKMFNAIGWTMNDQQDDDHSKLCTMTPPVEDAERGGYHDMSSMVHVIKRFDFVAKIQRMSAVVRDPKELKQRVYVKGSPEMIRRLCNEDSIPETFDYALSQYAQNGLRVIACATRVMDKEIMPLDNIEREEVETDLDFLGFMIFENRLKPATNGIIQKLNEANIKTVMLTGDNPLTAIFIARQCGILEATRKVMLGVLHTSEEDSSIKTLEWQAIEPSKIDGNEEMMQVPKDNSEEQTLVLDNIPIRLDVSGSAAPEDEANKQASGELTQRMRQDAIYNDNTIAISMTGEALSWIKNNNPDPSLYKNILKKAKVFARMRPEEKAMVVEEFQTQNRTVGMCGDGANDCPALKAANVGVSLSEAEASIAAPFLSKINDISCIDIVLREGRAALSTSFQCFKYMSMYSFIQTISVVSLYARKTCLTDGSYLFIDLFVILPLAITMSYTNPRNKLSRTQPSSSLFSTPILASIVGQLLIQAIFQVIMVSVLIKQDWYLDSHQLNPGVHYKLDDYNRSYDSTVLFLMANFQYIATVLAFSVGKPFRKAFYTNEKFLYTLLFATGASIVLVFLNSPGFLSFMDLIDIPMAFRWDILWIALLNCAVTLAYEKFGVPGLVAYGKQVKKRTN